MTTIEERTAYLQNPFLTKPLYGDFSAFYVTIAVCTVICVILIVLNVVLGCCSPYSRYWQDRHTGNRWLVSIWSATPHLQPPLDLTELEEVHTYRTLNAPPREYNIGWSADVAPNQEEFVELQKRESDI